MSTARPALDVVHCGPLYKGTHKRPTFPYHIKKIIARNQKCAVVSIPPNITARVFDVVNDFPTREKTIKKKICHNFAIV
jgi:hypothetical protein